MPLYHRTSQFKKGNNRIKTTPPSCDRYYMARSHGTHCTWLGRAGLVACSTRRLLLKLITVHNGNFTFVTISTLKGWWNYLYPTEWVLTVSRVAYSQVLWLWAELLKVMFYDDDQSCSTSNSCLADRQECLLLTHTDYVYTLRASDYRNLTAMSITFTADSVCVHTSLATFRDGYCLCKSLTYRRSLLHFLQTDCRQFRLLKQYHDRL